MIRSLRFLLLAVLGVMTLAFTACGDDDKDSSSSSGTSTGRSSSDQFGMTANIAAAKAAVENGKKGGKLTMLAASDVDFLDPGKTYYTFGFEVGDAIGRELYRFNPDTPDTASPDIADGEPEISDDKKTVTVKLKKGIKYAPPVNREVKADDIKYAFERFFSVNVGGQYPGYFQDITGAPKKPTKGVKPISGITTPDDQTVVFKMDKPLAVQLAGALVMPISTPVPREYAEKFDAKNPSTYNTNIAMSGPYMVRNNAKGELVGYKAGKSISIVRNPNWDEATDDRPALLDAIFIRTNASDANISSKQVIGGQSLVLDTNPPAATLRQVITQTKDQYLSLPSGGYRYFPMNTEIKPFDDLNVRKAVMAGFDRDAARLARGGKYVGDIATHWLPPDFPGFDQAGGLEGFPDLDYFNAKNVKGDMAISAKYFKAAGYASGKYEGNETLLMVGADADPGKAQAEVARAQLQKMGFKVKLRLVPQDSVYTEWCQVPAKKVAMCGGAGWFKDFNDPQSMLEPTFKGSLIARDGGNINYSLLNDPKIDAAMDKAALATGEDRLKQWGAIDRMIIEAGAGIPFIWDKTTLIRSKNVAGVANPYIALWDFSYTSLN